jgi:TatA/E family protein of Tat protein translocase
MQPYLAFLPSGQEWFWIVLVIILLFGSKKLPELARGLGRSVGEFKKARAEFEKELHDAVNETAAAKPASKDSEKTDKGPEKVS